MFDEMLANENYNINNILANIKQKELNNIKIKSIYSYATNATNNATANPRFSANSEKNGNIRPIDC
jgi:hypothetical protein